MYLNEIEAAIQTRIKELCAFKRLNGKRLFLFGCNIYVDHINHFLNEEGYELSGIIDNDKEKWGKRICNIEVLAPENAAWGPDSIVLIASRHKECMTEQLRQLSSEAEIYSLFDFAEYSEKVKKRVKFWLEENYQKEMADLYQGAVVYERIKGKEALVIFPIPSLGDLFIGGLVLYEYEKRLNGRDVKIITAFNGASKIAQLFGFGREKIEIISEPEMRNLVKFIYFCGIQNEDLICNWNTIFITMSSYKKMTFPKCWAKYFFKLGDRYEMCFPSIWDECLSETELVNKKLVKGKTMILVPYANSVVELPLSFWEFLAKKLTEKGFYVVTNIAGNQIPIKGTDGLEIPLCQIGTYLEFSGYFVSIRNGLCDVAGHSRCKQIVLFRDRKSCFHSSEIEFFDLHAENISENAIQLLYDDNDFFKNIDRVIHALLDTA